MHHFYVECGIQNWTNNQQTKLGVFIASIIHDVGHPAVNNALLIQTWDPLAIRYNDM